MDPIVIERVDGEPYLCESTEEYPPEGVAFYMSCEVPGEPWVVAAVAWTEIEGENVPYLYGIASDHERSSKGTERLMEGVFDYARHMNKEKVYADASNVEHDLLDEYEFTSTEGVWACRAV